MSVTLGADNTITQHCFPLVMHKHQHLSVCSFISLSCQVVKFRNGDMVDRRRMFPASWKLNKTSWQCELQLVYCTELLLFLTTATQLSISIHLSSHPVYRYICPATQYIDTFVQPPSISTHLSSHPVYRHICPATQYIDTFVQPPSISIHLSSHPVYRYICPIFAQVTYFVAV